MGRKTDVDAYLKARLADPDNVGSSEYRLVYDFVRDLMLDGEGTTNITGVLNELEDVVRTIRQRLNA